MKNLLTQIKKRKRYFYTDIELSSHIVKFLNLPKSSVILDSCCGTGNFLAVAKELGYEKIYGADIDKDTISLVKNNINTKTFRILDTLGNAADIF